MADKLLLLSCCAPCSCAVIKKLAEAGTDFAVVFYNPNIRPVAEYEKRRDENERVCQIYHVPFIELEYDNDSWCQATKGLENEPERGSRCLECFRMRLASAARYAHTHGYRVITTTLASSRWKSLEQINKAGMEAAAPYDDVVWWDRNWRKNGLQERRGELIRKYGFYNQQYCGCEFSLRSPEVCGTSSLS